MPSPYHSNNLVTIQVLLSHIEKMLLDTWQETGFGQLTIDSQRIKQNKIQVILRGSTHYRYILRQEDIEALIICPQLQTTQKPPLR